ncbi:MAG TPA: DegV family protein [Mobilitalea sp.]|nr:DegV family protein [Mobilitalea sp.]
MKEYQIFADSSCDLPESLLEEHDIRLIPFYVTFDQDIYYKENVEISNEEFYEKLNSKNVFSATSLPSVQDYITQFKTALRIGQDVLCLCLTQTFSGSYQSAVNAKQILEEQYPEANIQIIDSNQATAGEGILLLQLAYMKEAGLALKQVIEKFTLLKATARIMFTVDTLDYLSKGRRIGKAATLAGNMLDLKPLIQLKGAELIPYSNIRGRKKSLEKLISMMEEYFHETGEKKEEYDFCIANATTPVDAKYIQERVERFLGRKITYPVFQIGVTVGTYTGPGGIGICFVKKYDRI